MPKRRGGEHEYRSPSRSKRRRKSSLEVADQDGEDEIQPDFDRMTAAERRRASHRQKQIEEKAESDQSDHDGEGDGEQGRKSSPAAHGAIVGDHNEDDENGNDDSDEDSDDDGMHVDLQQHAKLSVKHGFASSGILHSVTVDRFMCHDCFTYPLGPNVNIIQGRNGSGKSCIVAALQIGLLANPTATERGKKLDDFIKHGHDNCVITIRILNKKPEERDDAEAEADFTYKHDLFGDMIVIERRIYKGKSGTFSIKSRNKHVKLPDGVTQRQEVQSIVDHFGFMVENPVAFLTQTKSKEFLAKGKPADHHRLYRTATLLGPLEDELRETKDVTEHVERILRSREQEIPNSEAKLQKKEAEHREAQEMKNIHALIREAKRRLAWTLLEEEEIKLQRFEERTREEFEPKAEQTRLAAEQSVKKMEELTQIRNNQSKSLEEATAKSRTLAQTLREAHKKANTSKLEIERQRRRIVEFDAEIDSLQSRIQGTRENMEKARDAHFAGQEQKSAMIQELKDNEELMKQLQEQIAAAGEQEGTLHTEKMSLQEEMSQITRRTDQLRRDYEAKRREHMRVSATARNKDDLVRFGDVAPELSRRIRQRENQFHRPPIGPVGHYVKMKDESWAAAVEMAIGRGTLRSFIVHDGHDASLLERMIPKTNFRPSIIVCNIDRDRYAVHRSDMPDVSSHGHQTILETVDIQHNAVFNTLLDHSQIERNVLNATDEDITQLGWKRIPNLHCVWNKRCDRAYTRNGSNTFRKGPQRVNAIMLTRDMRPYLQGLEGEIEVIQRDIEEQERRGGDISRRLTENSHAIRKVKGEAEHCSRKVREVQSRKIALEDQLDRAENAFDPQPFESEIAQFEQNISEQVNQKRNAENQIQASVESMERTDAETEKAKLVFREAKREMEQLTKEAEKVSDQFARVKSKDKEIRRQKDAAAELLARAQSEINKQKSSVAEQMQDARAVGDCPEDIDSRKTPSSKCKQSVTMLERRLETEQDRRGGRTANEIEMEYLRAKRQYDENREVLERIQYYVKSLNRGIKNRNIKLIRLNKSLKNMVRANFRKFLARRGHTGSILFKTKNEVRELHLVAQIATHVKEDGELHTTDDMKSLSGGEKSFLTLSFILSLAELCQNPVRVMDEIDVFQDEASRRASFKTTVHLFNEFLTNRQIIIITPHPLPGIQSTQKCRILNMPAPREDTGGRQTRISDYIS